MSFHPTLWVEEGHALREYLLNISHGDVLLMCSCPKMFEDEREAAHIARADGATLLTITDSEISALLLKSGCNIGIRQREKHFLIPMSVPWRYGICSFLRSMSLHRKK